jgi:purine-nucleoside phosphorylase
VQEVVFGSELLAAMGCSSVILTNAAGGIRHDLRPGSLMLIEDHVNLTGSNPLRGPGHVFLDMTHAYDPALRQAAFDAALRTSIPLSRGVYAGLLGPSYETPAEIRMLRTLGADAVGMSTVLEAIALRRAGVRVGAVSCITNAAAGVSEATLDHAEVQAVAAASADAFRMLLSEWVQMAATLG